MVVGRRRVAAASVATAYALHVYVLPNTIFDRPKPAIPPTHPHCRKVGVHSCSGYFSWVLVLHPFRPLFLSLPPPPTHPLSLSFSLFRSTTTLPNPPSSCTYSSRVRICSSFLLRATRRDATRRTTPSLALVYPRLSIHCSRSLSFSPIFHLSFSRTVLARLGLSQCPTPELK